MEKIAYELGELFVQKLSAYRELIEILNQDREAVTRMDIDAMWRSSRQKNAAAARLKQLRQEILERLGTLDTLPGAAAAEPGLKGLVERLALLPKDRFSLLKTVHAIDEAKREVTRLARENRRCVHDHVDMINGIMSSLTGGASGAVYTQDARVPRAQSPRPLFRAEV
jgi:hypothetical protein